MRIILSTVLLWFGGIPSGGRDGTSGVVVVGNTALLNQLKLHAVMGLVES